MLIYLFEEEGTVIKTERLTLRPLEKKDAADIFEIRGDCDTADDAGVPPMVSIEEAEKYIIQWVEDSVAIVLGDEVIGLIESYRDDELLYDCTFLGYYLKKKYRGNGYMTEAVTALKKAMADGGETDVALWIYPENRASKRVAIKSGFSSLGVHLADIGGFNTFVEFFG